MLTGTDSPITREILQALMQRYPRLEASADLKTLSARPGPAVYTTISPAALAAALAPELNQPIISLFTSSPVFHALLAQRPPRRALVTALYAEVSPAEQMSLIASIYHRRVSVGVLLSEQTASLEGLIEQAAARHGLALQLESVRSAEAIDGALARIASSAVLLAVPDARIYTAANLRTILESTYRRGQAVVGFSTGMVAAGALAAAYASIEDTLAQFEEPLAAVAAGRIPNPQFPRYWRITINESVARSLNISIDTTVRALGNPPPGKRP